MSSAFDFNIVCIPKKRSVKITERTFTIASGGMEYIDIVLYNSIFSLSSFSHKFFIAFEFDKLNLLLINDYSLTYSHFLLLFVLFFFIFSLLSLFLFFSLFSLLFLIILLFSIYFLISHIISIILLS